jgi:hypothetical protein
MTHLTATIAAISPESVRAIDRAAQVDGADCLAPQAVAESIFYSPVANFLELVRAAFHYSVIGVHALDTLAPGLGDRHISYDVRAAPNTRGEAAGVRARAGGK